MKGKAFQLSIKF